MQRQHATLLLLSRNQPEEQHLDPEHRLEVRGSTDHFASPGKEIQMCAPY